MSDVFDLFDWSDPGPTIWIREPFTEWEARGREIHDLTKEHIDALQAGKVIGLDVNAEMSIYIRLAPAQKSGTQSGT